MGLLDIIARNLAHVTDATRSVNTFMPVVEDPTAALQDALERRRRAYAEAYGPDIGPTPLDELVIDPTIKVRYVEKPSMVEMSEVGGNSNNNNGGGGRRRGPNNEINNHDGGGGYTEGSDGGDVADATEDVKEMTATTRHANPYGVRFVGDREGWDKCLAEMAAEERRRQTMGDAYVSNRRRRRGVGGGRQASEMMSDYGSEGGGAAFEAVQQRVASPRGGYGAGGFDDYSTASSSSSSDGDSGNNAASGGRRTQHYDSDDDDAMSVYTAMEGGHRRRQRANNNNHNASSHNVPRHYKKKVQKLKAPRLEAKVFTHVHRCVGTEDLTTAADYEGASLKGNGYTYKKGGQAITRTSTRAPVAIAGKRVKFLYITLMFAAFHFTILLWAYLSYLRYYLSGDARFRTGGAYWTDGLPAYNVTYGLNDTLDVAAGMVTVQPFDSAPTVATDITEDGAWVRVGGETKRVKTGTLIDDMLRNALPGGSGLTLNAMGQGYLACTIAGLFAVFLILAYTLCYVNGLRYRSNIRDVVRMKEVSDELRGIEGFVSVAAGGDGDDGPAEGRGGRTPEQRQYEASMGMVPASPVGARRGQASAGSQSPFGPAAMFAASMGGPMSPLGMLNLQHPSWAPEIPEHKIIDKHADINARVEQQYGWLLPILFFPIPVADFLLANPSKERKKVVANLMAIFLPLWVLGVIPAIVLMIVISDVMDRYSITVLARSMGGIDVPICLALLMVALFEFLPVYWFYHRKAGQFVESRYN